MSTAAQRWGDSLGQWAIPSEILAQAPTSPWVHPQSAMLVNFVSACDHLGLTCQTVEGTWPAVADVTPVADVVVCHHVAYNVADIGPFLRALMSHARLQVVFELPQSHPTAPFSPLWKHFWNVERPSHPTAEDFVAVVRELGYAPTVDRFRREPRKARLDTDAYVAFVRTRLCLTESRDIEVASVLSSMGPGTGPLSNDELVTVSWT
jgi:hypothetical protein